VKAGRRASFGFFAAGIQVVEVQDGVVNNEVAALCFGAPHWIVGKKDNVSTIDGNADVGISGAKDRRSEPDRLMTDARRRRFDVVLVARFDRCARSTKHLVLALEEFNTLSIDLVSLNESIDTSTPMGKMFTVIGAVA